MIPEYKHIDITIFSSKIELVEKILPEIYKERYDSFSKESVSSFEHLTKHKFINPKPKASNPTSFMIWNNESDPDKTFFLSNAQDGMSNLTRIITKKIKGDSIKVKLSTDEEEYPMNSMRKMVSGVEVRYIHAMKDSKWVFFEKGTPSDYENLDLYKKRRVKDKFNIEIIMDYLNKENINFNQVFSSINQGFLYVS